MTGRCHHCHAKTMALPGAQARFARALPPPDYRLGFVIEKPGRSWLVCEVCIGYMLPANVAA